MRIDILEPLGSQYRVLHHFSRKLFEALERKGINCRYVPVENGTIHLNWNDLPDCTIGFNVAPTSGSGEELLCDQIATPHLAILVDSPTWHYQLTNSPFTILACDDRSGNRFLDSIPFTRNFFLPHAVERDIAYNPHEEKIYDVTFLATNINHEQRRKAWFQLFPHEVCHAMDAAVEMVFAHPEKGFLDAFQETLHQYVPSSKDYQLSKNPDFLMLCLEVELYIKGKERVDLIRSITDADIHIFGASLGASEWKKELNDRTNVHFHPPVSFEEAFKIMRQSKILLNSSLKNKEGAHERIFMGLASGAAVVTNDCPFMREEFTDGEDIILYNPAKIESLNEQVNELLRDNAHLNSIIQSGRTRVLSKHTWDHRVDTIMEKLPKVLEDMPLTN
jgi:glycosyltransferase involved in cell wall biosynthesis